jgi:trimethylamine--corrinoid protein Co-methyltransferase
VLFGPGSGCPNVSDRLRGRRAGSLESYRETMVFQQAFDVIHFLGLSAEPQDVALPHRHYAMIGSQLELADKQMFVFARGRGQVQESFEMIRLGLNLSEADWDAGAWCYTVINSNSPRMFDNPMAQGIIDFARAGQMLVITPFCLAGAMAPVTVAGALVLQHAEALAGITLAQMVRPGAPVSYGGFSSNVDMKSGAPAFGTPEHLKMQIGSGQLARHIGFPWRSASGSASNTADMQGAQETDHALWGAMMGQATMILHAAGWLEGGLTFGYEKFINDVESLQVLAEMCRPAGISLPRPIRWSGMRARSTVRFWPT